MANIAPTSLHNPLSGSELLESPVPRGLLSEHIDMIQLKIKEVGEKVKAGQIPPHKAKVLASGGFSVAFLKNGAVKLIVVEMHKTEPDAIAFDKTCSGFSGKVELSDGDQPIPAIIYRAIREFREETEDCFQLSDEQLESYARSPNTTVLTNANFYNPGKHSALNFLINIPQEIAEAGMARFNSSLRAAESEIQSLHPIDLSQTLSHAVDFFHCKVPNLQGEWYPNLDQERIALENSKGDLSLQQDVRRRMNLHLPIEEGAQNPVVLADYYARDLAVNAELLFLAIRVITASSKALPSQKEAKEEKQEN